MASIQFSRGVIEDAVPDIKVTRSRNLDGGKAIFYFEAPKALDQDSTDEITGMYLIDDEGEIVSRDVKGKFINGKASAIEATLLMIVQLFYILEKSVFLMEFLPRSQ